MTVPDDWREAGAEIEIAAVESRLAWMRKTRIWPNGPRYLWTDAFGVVLLVSLWREIRDDRLLRECELVVAEVERVLGRPPGIRIGEEPDRDGQYFHYLAMWIFALERLGAVDSAPSVSARVVFHEQADRLVDHHVASPRVK